MGGFNCDGSRSAANGDPGGGVWREGQVEKELRPFDVAAPRLGDNRRAGQLSFVAGSPMRNKLRL